MKAAGLPASHPSRGAWIEINSDRGLSGWLASRTPRGVRGLKSDDHIRYFACGESHPSRGAWIEIELQAQTQLNTAVAPLAGCVD